MKEKCRIILIAVVLLSTMAGLATAGTVTQNLTYQGTLTDSSGNPLTNTYFMTFRLYDAASGGNTLSSSGQPVSVNRGLFTAPIPFPANFFDGRALWLGITVGSDPEMSPRQEIRPESYALSIRPEAIIRGNATSYGSYVVTVMNSDLVSERNGLSVETKGSYSKAVYALTSGLGSPGMYTITRGNDAHGVFAVTYGNGSVGYKAITKGDWSPGIDVTASGVNSDGINVYSEKGYGIKSNTNVTNGYGFFSDDYIYARGSQFPTSDVAEYMPVSEEVKPGTVLVIGKAGILQPCEIQYDTRVAGIVSTKPGVFLGVKNEGNPGEALIAVAGRVPCKVDASYGAIHPGDVLTTSSKPGYAMKASPVNISGVEIYKPSTVLGKALGTLESGTGTIEVLVTLQ